MTTHEHLKQLALTQKILTKLIDRHPKMTLENATEALLGCVSIACTFDLSETSIEQAASKAMEEIAESGALPPWEG